MGSVQEEVVGSGPRVAQWYAGRSVLVTGATGFLGKAIVEKLLRSCPDIGTVYMLVRPKQGQDPHERLEAYASNVVFSVLREQRPDFDRHLSVVAGDLSAPDFLVAEEDLAALRRDVSVVFHCAANVHFDISLREAVTCNVVGVQRVLQLAQQLPNLQVFVYISTSFCHSDHPVLEEKLYPAKADPEKIMDIISWLDDDILKDITPRLLRNLPNTYSLSKNMAEELVARYSNRLPIVIARPSIVIPSLKEPVEGWTDNFNGFVGFFVAAGKGVLRALLVNANVAADCIPVDLTANSIILVAWYFSEERQQSPYVFNVTTGNHFRMTWGQMWKEGAKILKEIPFKPIMWYPDLIITTSVVWYTICHFFLEVVPAHFFDLLIFLSGRKPFLVKIQNRLQSAEMMVRYYASQEWCFINKRSLSLYEYMSTEDKKIFTLLPSALSSFDSYDYTKKVIIGVKLFLLNESIDDLCSDRKYFRRMYWLHTAVRLIFYGLLLWLLYSWSQPAIETLETAMTYVTSLFRGAPFIRAYADKIVGLFDVATQDDVQLINN